MLEQLFDHGDRARQPRGGLHHQPLVDHQRLAAPFLVESLERGIALGAVELREPGEGGHRVGHVVGAAELLVREGRVAELGKVAEARVVHPEPVVRRPERCFQLGGEHCPQAVARGVQRVGVHHFELLGEEALGRQVEHLGREDGVLLLQHAPQRLDEGG